MSATDSDIAPFIPIGSAAAAVVATMCEPRNWGTRDEAGVMKIKASPPPHIRFCAGDWFTGVAGLKADERGVLISMCVYIWTTGQRVPLDDAEAARRLCLQFNLYQRIRDKLLRLGKVTRHVDGYGNVRAEAELEKAIAARSKAGDDVRADGRPDARQERKGRPEPAPARGNDEGTEKGHSGGRSEAHVDAAPGGALLSAPMGAYGGACQGAYGGAHGGDRQNSEQKQRCLIEPITKNQEPKKIHPSSQVAAREPEPAGWLELKSTFNGSTELMLADVQAWMGPTARRDNAIRWLTGTLAAYGASRTAQAWTIVTTKIASGQPVASPLPLWAKTAAGLTTAKPAKSVEPMRFDPLTPLNLRPVLQEPCL